MIGAIMIIAITVLGWVIRKAIMSIDTLTRSQAILLTHHGHFADKHNSHESTLSEHSRKLAEHDVQLGKHDLRLCNLETYQQ
jgi:hypothetical protein